MRVWSVPLLVLGSAGPLAAQGAELRYRPDPGQVVRTLTELRTVTTLFGFPAVPDGAAFEDERRLSATQRVLGAADATRTVEVVIDSVRTRRRPTAGAWVAVSDTMGIGVPARAVVDDRFLITGIETAAVTDGHVLRTLGAGMVGLGFRFPEGPVSAGQSFKAGGRVRVDVTLVNEAGIPLQESIAGDLLLVVDSIASSGADELTFFQFSGRFAPLTAAAESEAGDLASSFTGSFAGRLIWSRGWNAFVSGAGRFQIEGRLRSTTAAGQLDAAVGWDITLTHRLRA